MYTLTEFRKNLRKAFNDADEGHEVVIERYGQKFQLISLVDAALGGSSLESTPTHIKPIKTPTVDLMKQANDKLADAIDRQNIKAGNKLFNIKTPKNPIPKSFSARKKK